MLLEWDEVVVDKKFHTPISIEHFDSIEYDANSSLLEIISVYFIQKKVAAKGGVDNIYAPKDDSDNFICLVSELILLAIKKIPKDHWK